MNITDGSPDPPVSPNAPGPGASDEQAAEDGAEFAKWLTIVGPLILVPFGIICWWGIGDVYERAYADALIRETGLEYETLREFYRRADGEPTDRLLEEFGILEPHARQVIEHGSTRGWPED